MVELVESSRGSITLKIDDKVIQFNGEALLPTEGSPDWVIFSKMIFDANTQVYVGEKMAKVYMGVLKEFATEKEWLIEFE